MAEVNFPMGKAHVTDVIVTTKYWQQSACHSILRELKITHKKKIQKESIGYADCMCALQLGCEVVSNNIAMY
jgi:hypothetical protein